MEFLSIFLNMFLAMTVEHLIYSATGAFVLLFVISWFYCKVTSGVFISDHDMAGKTVLITGASDGVPKQKTEDGCELVMQTNHLGHFLLTSLLLDLLKKSSPSRIINVSSVFHYFAQLNFDDLTNKAEIWPLFFYCNSKLANILFTKELARRLNGTGVTVNALHPGYVKTNILGDKKGIIPLIVKVGFEIFAKTSKEGAQTIIQLAVDPNLEKTTGKYFADCKETTASKSATDRTLARQLFKLSEEIVGLT